MAPPGLVDAPWATGRWVLLVTGSLASEDTGAGTDANAGAVAGVGVGAAPAVTLPVPAAVPVPPVVVPEAVVVVPEAVVAVPAGDDPEEDGVEEDGDGEGDGLARPRSFVTTLCAWAWRLAGSGR